MTANRSIDVTHHLLRPSVALALQDDRVTGLYQNARPRVSLTNCIIELRDSLQSAFKG